MEITDNHPLQDPEMDITNTPPEVMIIAEETSQNLLPEKSRERYKMAYNTFMEWRERNKVHSFSENVILAYFNYLANKYKSSSLWALYSMLRSTISLNHNVDIEKYAKLRAFLKRKSEGFVAKKSKTFTPEEIHTFLNDAPDEIYLVTKVALIMGIMGACRCGELYAIDEKDIQDLGSSLLITIPNTNTKIVRRFTISDNFYEICKKYINLRRTTNGKSSGFFLNYQKGKCYSQRIGVNKTASMGKSIATYLKLKDPHLYTGHSFRRSSATLYVDAGVDITGLKRHGGWKSTSVAEGYIDDSLQNKMNTANRIIQSVNGVPVTASSSSSRSSNIVNDCDVCENQLFECNNSVSPPRNEVHFNNNMNSEKINFDLNSNPAALNLNNCYNITINLVNNQ